MFNLRTKDSKNREEWRTREKARKKTLKEVIDGFPDDEQQSLERTAEVLNHFASDLVESICDAASRRSRWHTAGRLGAAASSIAAAGSGGALTAGLGGRGGLIFGLVSLALGLYGAAVTAVGADVEYARDHQKASRYEQLWWDIWIYSADELLSTPSSFSKRLGEFVRLRAGIRDPGPPRADPP